MSGLMKNGCFLLLEGGILVRVECVVLGGDEVVLGVWN